jgi:ketosteroid isomerase-like protein
MRFSMGFVAPVLAAGLVMPAAAQEADQQMRQQIEAVHTKWVDAVNKGDVVAFSTLLTPSCIAVDPFGMTIGVNTERLQAIFKKGITVSFPIDGVQALKGGQAAIAYGTFTSKYTDPNVPPGQGSWLQVFERDGEAWKIRAYANSRTTLAAQLK